eukprot:9033638-Lingulodinium_polyedra.AAC.1
MAPTPRYGPKTANQWPINGRRWPINGHAMALQRPFAGHAMRNPERTPDAGDALNALSKRA